MKNFFYKLISTNTLTSSKRFITLIAFIMMCIGFISNLFFEFKIDENIYTSMEYIVIAGLGFTASERFAKQIPGVTTPLPPESALNEPDGDNNDRNYDHDKCDGDRRE